jgi:hypothetical protein
MVHGGGNKAGRFLEVSVFAEGGRKGVIWLPEGRYGRGWQRFAGELRNLVAGEFNKTKLTRSSLDDPPSGFSTGRSFVDVLQSTLASRQKILVGRFFLLPFSICFRCSPVLRWGLLGRRDLPWTALQWSFCLGLRRRRLRLCD